MPEQAHAKDNASRSTNDMEPVAPDLRMEEKASARTKRRRKGRRAGGRTDKCALDSGNQPLTLQTVASLGALVVSAAATGLPLLALHNKMTKGSFLFLERRKPKASAVLDDDEPEALNGLTTETHGAEGKEVEPTKFQSAVIRRSIQKQPNRDANGDPGSPPSDNCSSLVSAFQQICADSPVNTPSSGFMKPIPLASPYNLVPSSMGSSSPGQFTKAVIKRTRRPAFSEVSNSQSLFSSPADSTASAKYDSTSGIPLPSQTSATSSSVHCPPETSDQMSDAAEASAMDNDGQSYKPFRPQTARVTAKMAEDVAIVCADLSSASMALQGCAAPLEDIFATLQSTEGQVEELTQLLKSMSSSKAAAEEGLVAQANRIKGLENQLAEEQTAYNLGKDSMMQRLQKAEEAAAAADLRAEQLLDEHKRREEIESALREDLRSAELEKIKLQTQLKADSESRAAAAEADTNFVAALQAELEDAKNELRCAVDQLAAKQGEEQNAAQEAKNMSARLEEITGLMHAENMVNAEEKRVSEQTLQEIREKLKAETQNKENLEALLVERTASVEAAKAETQALEAQMAELSARMEELKEQLQAETGVHDEEQRAAEELLQDIEKKLEAATQRGDSLEALLAQSTASEEAAKAQVTGLEVQLLALAERQENEAEIQGRKMEELQSAEKNLEGQLEAVRRQGSGLSKQLAKQKAAEKAAEEQIEVLKTQLADVSEKLQMEVARNEGNSEIAEQKAKEACEKLQDAQQHVQSLQAMIDKKAAAESSALAQVASLQAELSEAQNLALLTQQAEASQLAIRNSLEKVLTAFDGATKAGEFGKGMEAELDFAVEALSAAGEVAAADAQEAQLLQQMFKQLKQQLQIQEEQENSLQELLAAKATQEWEQKARISVLEVENESLTHQKDIFESEAKAAEEQYEAERQRCMELQERLKEVEEELESEREHGKGLDEALAGVQSGLKGVESGLKDITRTSQSGLRSHLLRHSPPKPTGAGILSPEPSPRLSNCADSTSPYKPMRLSALSDESSGKGSDDSDLFSMPVTQAGSVSALLLAIESSTIQKRQGAAAALLRTCSSDAVADKEPIEQLRLVHGAGGLKILLAAAADRDLNSSSARLRATALELLRLLAVSKGAELCEDLVAANGLPTLVRALDSRSGATTEERTAAAAVLRAVSEHPSCWQQMTASGAVRVIVSALHTDRSEEAGLIESCAIACSHLSKDAGALGAMQRAGGRFLLGATTRSRLATDDACKAVASALTRLERADS